MPPLTENSLSREQFTGKDFGDELFIALRTPKMCEYLYLLPCQNGGPKQKAIVIGTREIHADRAAQHIASTSGGATRTGKPRMTVTLSGVWMATTTVPT